MGKNHKGGKKQKSQKNSNQVVIVKLDEIRPDNIDTFVGIVVKALGCKRFSVLNLETNIEVQALIPGSSRTRIATGDYVKLQITQEFSGSNAFILHKYSTDELTALEIKKVVQNTDGTIDINEDSDDVFDFEAI